MHGRLRAVRASGDQGSVLAIAMAFLMVFGVYVGIVLQFSATGLRTQVTVRDVVTNASAGAGALDGAINTLRSTPAIGIAPAPAFSCFTLPANELGNPTPVGVTCEPRAVSGNNVTGPTPSQPGNAITALSTVATEGVSVTGATTKTVRGGVKVNRRLTVPVGATLDGSGYPMEAFQCLVAGTVSPTCVNGGPVGDPNYPDPDVSTAASPAVQQTTLPACGSGTTLTLNPGIYRSRAALQTVLSCASATTIRLSTGTYYFDFNLAGSHALLFAGGARRIIGGTISGPSCDRSAAGVELVFGGDSSLAITSGQVHLCSLVPDAVTTAQHVVLRGLKAPMPVATTLNVNGATATSVAGGTAWVNPNNGAIPNTVPVFTTTSLAGPGRPDAVLRVALPAAVVPTDATVISATITVKEWVNANAAATAATRVTATLNRPAIPPAIGAPVPGGSNLPVKTCSATPCTGLPFVDHTTTPITGLTPALLNGTPATNRATIDVRLTKPGAGNANAAIDGVTLNLSYRLPMRQVCVLASPAAGCTATPPTAQMFSATGVYTATGSLELRGTIYAPTARVTLGQTLVYGTVVDRGIVVWHLILSMTPAAGGPWPPMIKVPSLGEDPRRVIMTATDGAGARLARADVTFANPAGTLNGDIPRVLEWSVG